MVTGVCKADEGGKAHVNLVLTTERCLILMSPKSRNEDIPTSRRPSAASCERSCSRSLPPDHKRVRGRRSSY